MSALVIRYTCSLVCIVVGVRVGVVVVESFIDRNFSIHIAAYVCITTYFDDKYLIICGTRDNNNVLFKCIRKKHINLITSAFTTGRLFMSISCSSGSMCILNSSRMLTLLLRVFAPVV